MTDKTWHVVHTLARGEWRAHHGLRRQGFDTLLLHYAGTTRHARRERLVLKPLFQRYLFVAVERGQGYYRVGSTPGVAEVLAGVDGPVKVAPKIIRVLRDRADPSGRVDLPKAGEASARTFQPGEVVRVAAGPLTGFKAIVELDNRGHVRVRLAAFGGAITVVIPAGALAPLHQQGANRPKLIPRDANSLVK